MTAPQPMGALFDQYESKIIEYYRATTTEQRAAEDQRRQAQRDHEAKHTAIETDEDRANLDEYPAEDETE